MIERVVSPSKGATVNFNRVICSLPPPRRRTAWLHALSTGQEEPRIQIAKVMPDERIKIIDASRPTRALRYEIRPLEAAFISTHAKFNRANDDFD